MVELRPNEGRPVIDYAARDYDSLLRAMRAVIPEKLPEWTDFANEADFGNVLLELFAYLGDVLSYYQDRVANESYLVTAQTRRSVIEHLRLIGYELGTAAPAATTVTLSVPDDVTDTVTLAAGTAFGTTSQRGRPSVRFEYTGAGQTLDFGGAAVDSTGRRSIANIPVQEGRRFTDRLGQADGSAGQRFPLLHTGAILRRPGTTDGTGDDVQVTTKVGAAGPEITWARRETLAFSQATDRHFLVLVDAADSATIVFGDGTFGARAEAGANVSVTYRVGGGAAGNVPAGAVTTLVDAPDLARLGATVTNPGAATGGADRETTDQAVQHAPLVYRSLRRAVTAADYEALALSFPGVGKVRAVATGWNTVTLYVAPEGGGKVSDVLEAGLQAYFEDKRMLSQIVEVSDVDYVPIYVTAELGIESSYDENDVVARVQEAVAELLAFDQVGFGQTVYLSKFYEVCQETPGVLYVNISQFPHGDPDGQQVGTFALGPDQIPVVPSDPDYALGLKVVPVHSGGR